MPGIPNWSASQNAQTAAIGQANQLLGTHSNQYIYEGSSIVAVTGQYSSSVQSLNVTRAGTQPTIQVAQPFTMSGTEIDRVVIPTALVSGVGYDVNVALYNDSAGVPGTQIANASITVPKEWLQYAFGPSTTINNTTPVADSSTIPPNTIQTSGGDITGVGICTALGCAMYIGGLTNLADSNTNAIMNAGAAYAAFTGNTAPPVLGQWTSGPNLPTVSSGNPGWGNMGATYCNGNIVLVGGQVYPAGTGAALVSVNTAQNIYTATFDGTTLGGWTPQGGLGIGGAAAATALGNYVLAFIGASIYAFSVNTGGQVGNIYQSNNGPESATPTNGVCMINVKNPSSGIYTGTLIITGTSVWSANILVNNNVANNGLSFLGGWKYLGTGALSVVVPAGQGLIGYKTSSVSTAALDTSGNMGPWTAVNNSALAVADGVWSLPLTSGGAIVAVPFTASSGPGSGSAAQSSLFVSRQEVSVPLRVTGLTNTTKYHLVVTGSASNPLDAMQVPLVTGVSGGGAFTALSNIGGAGWVAYTTGTAMPITLFAGTSGRVVHVNEDGFTQVSWNVSRQDSTLAAVGQSVGLIRAMSTFVQDPVTGAVTGLGGTTGYSNNVWGYTPGGGAAGVWGSGMLGETWTPQVVGTEANASGPDQFLTYHTNPVPIYTGSAVASSNNSFSGTAATNTGAVTQYITQAFGVGGTATNNTSTSANATAIGFSAAPLGFLNGDQVYVDVGTLQDVVTIQSGAGTTSWTVTPPLVHAHNANVSVVAVSTRAVTRIEVEVFSITGSGADTTLSLSQVIPVTSGVTSGNNLIAVGATSLTGMSTSGSFTNGQYIVVDVQGTNPETTQLVSGAGTATWVINPAMSFAHAASVVTQGASLQPTMGVIATTTLPVEFSSGMSNTGVISVPFAASGFAPGSFLCVTIAGTASTSNFISVYTAAQVTTGLATALVLTGPTTSGPWATIAGKSLAMFTYQGNYGPLVNTLEDGGTKWTGYNTAGNPPTYSMEYVGSQRMVWLNQYISSSIASVGAVGGGSTPTWRVAPTATQPTAAQMNQSLTTHAPIAYVYSGANNIAQISTTTAAGTLGTNTGAAAQWIAQQFSSGSATQLSWAAFYWAANTGTGTDVTIELRTNNAGVPSNTVLWSIVLPVEFFVSAMQWNVGATGVITVPIPITLTSTTTYWLVADGTASTANFANVRTTTAVASQHVWTSPSGTGTWTDTGKSSDFIVRGGTNFSTGVLYHTLEDFTATGSPIRWTTLMWGSGASANSLNNQPPSAFGEYVGSVRQVRTYAYSNGSLTSAT